MDEELQLILDSAEEQMQKALDFLSKTLVSIRAGKADPGILHGINVDYYGVQTPLTQVANVNTPDSKTIAIQPWEKQMISPIEKAIMEANLGLTPFNNGDVVRLNLPPLTEERRKDLVKQARNEGKQTKVSIRTVRRDANEEIKTLQKDGLAEDTAKDAENEIQNFTNKYNKLVDEKIEKKEKDIMTV